MSTQSPKKSHRGDEKRVAKRHAEDEPVVNHRSGEESEEEAADSQRRLDAAGEESFPASDPPSFTPGQTG